MDITGVRHIVNYDPPATAKVYVHRAGRTARAGQEGDVWTLVTEHEMRWFWKYTDEIKRASDLEKVKVRKDEISQRITLVYNTIIG
jgi:ATP-dependent RNA helicase DDX51/DBP6